MWNFYGSLHQIAKNIVWEVGKNLLIVAHTFHKMWPLRLRTSGSIFLTILQFSSFCIEFSVGFLFSNNQFNSRSLQSYESKVLHNTEVTWFSKSLISMQTFVEFRNSVLNVCFNIFNANIGGLSTPKTTFKFP